MVEFYIMPDGDALEQAMQMDREFFERNPERADYCRLAIPGEDFGYFPPMTVVHVMNCGDGMRTRAFYPPPEILWEELEERVQQVGGMENLRKSLGGSATVYHHRILDTLMPGFLPPREDERQT